MTILIEAYTGVESVFAFGRSKPYQNMQQLLYRIKEVTRVTKATDNAVMRIVLPEIFPKVTFSVSQIGA